MPARKGVYVKKNKIINLVCSLFEMQLANFSLIFYVFS